MVPEDSNGGGELSLGNGLTSQPLEWKFSQVFGECAAGEEVQEGIFTPYYCFILNGVFYGIVLCNGDKK